MERGRRAQAAGAILRGVGADRRSHRRRPQAAVDDPVFVKSGSQGSNRRRISSVSIGTHMPINADYRGPAELPEIIPVFPLPGALLLPRGQMPLNIFEPRYLAMVDDCLRDGHRLIGMIQPDATHSTSDERPALFRVGCVGRITQLAESGDGR